MTTGFYAEAIRRCSCDVQSAVRYGKQRSTELYGVFRYRYGKIMFAEQTRIWSCVTMTLQAKSTESD